MSVFSLPPLEVAHYNHTSLYEYQPSAVREVINRFRDIADADPAKWNLAYNDEHEVILTVIKRWLIADQ
jgi:hypothetical protein